jgi:hypothetical protein
MKHRSCRTPRNDGEFSTLGALLVVTPKSCPPSSWHPEGLLHAAPAAYPEAALPAAIQSTLSAHRPCLSWLDSALQISPFHGEQDLPYGPHLSFSRMALQSFRGPPGRRRHPALRQNLPRHAAGLLPAQPLQPGAHHPRPARALRCRARRKRLYPRRPRLQRLARAGRARSRKRTPASSPTRSASRFRGPKSSRNGAASSPSASSTTTPTRWSSAMSRRSPSPRATGSTCSRPPTPTSARSSCSTPTPPAAWRRFSTTRTAPPRPKSPTSTACCTASGASATRRPSACSPPPWTTRS